MPGQSEGAAWKQDVQDAERNSWDVLDLDSRYTRFSLLFFFYLFFPPRETSPGYVGWRRTSSFACVGMGIAWDPGVLGRTSGTPRRLDASVWFEHFRARRTSLAPRAVEGGPESSGAIRSLILLEGSGVSKVLRDVQCVWSVWVVSKTGHLSSNPLGLGNMDWSSTQTSGSPRFPA